MSDNPLPTEPIKKARGWPKGKPRPKKNPELRPSEPPPVQRPPLRADLHAEPVWADSIDPTMGEDDGTNPLQFPPDLLALLPKEVSFRWVRTAINGQPDGPNRASAEKAGWQPIYPHFFNHALDGRYAPKGDTHEITFDGSLVLMGRHTARTKRARDLEYKKAREQVVLKEAQFTGGDLRGVSLDASHPSAVNSNRISKSFERIDVPKE